MKRKLALFTAAVMTATAILPAVDPGMTVSAKTQMTYAITGEQFEAITGTTGAELFYAHGGCIYCDAADADTAIDPEMKKGLRLVQPIGGVTATGGTTITEQINVNNGFSVAYSVYMGKSSGSYGSHKINYGDGFVFGIFYKNRRNCCYRLKLVEE